MKQIIRVLAGALAVMAAALTAGCASNDSYDRRLAIVNAIKKATEQQEMVIEIHEELTAPSNPNYSQRSDLSSVYLYQKLENGYAYRLMQTDALKQSDTAWLGYSPDAKAYAVRDAAVDKDEFEDVAPALDLVDLYNVTTDENYAAIIKEVTEEAKGENTLYSLVLDGSANNSMPMDSCTLSYEVDAQGLLVAFYATAEGVDNVEMDLPLAFVMKTQATIRYALSDQEKAELAALVQSVE